MVVQAILTIIFSVLISTCPVAEYREKNIPVMPAEAISFWLQNLSGITESGVKGCIPQAIYSVQNWQYNDGLFIASSETHAFVACLTRANPYDLDSWAFFEPGSGWEVALGIEPYHFPIQISLETDISETKRGHTPLMRLDFDSP